ncbi:MAG: hypothetical protein [Bacteriophage sp.]|nr:MAG: hypothetical protein [Bacteriophage sp.]
MRTIERDPIVILSLGYPATEEGNRITAKLLNEITGLEHTPVKGCFEGEEESSVILPLSIWTQNETALVRLLTQYGQQCILFADGQRNAWLCPAPHYAVSLRTQDRKFLGELVSRAKNQMTAGLPKSYTEVAGSIHYVR